MVNQQPLPSIYGPMCPVPLPHSERIVMGHGSGGKMMSDLITKTFLPQFDNPILRAGDDGGVIPSEYENKLVISTDAHVVWPLFFPGGDIGKLAVCGTVNDVAMMGAIPHYLTASFIIEEGFPLSILKEIVISMKKAAEEASVQIVAGDTKVVQKGKADGIYISTSGIGLLIPGVDIRGANAKPGDVIILSGPIGDHGIAVLCARGELGFETDIQSDVAPLNSIVKNMIEASPEIHVLRDPTRGGVASSLNEIAKQSGVCALLYENEIPVRLPVQAACEMLGFDPLYIANEGKLIAIVKNEVANDVLLAMRNTKYGESATIIGKIQTEPHGRVLMKTTLGSTRIVDTLSGELLPRIC